MNPKKKSRQPPANRALDLAHASGSQTPQSTWAPGMNDSTTRAAQAGKFLEASAATIRDAGGRRSGRGLAVTHSTSQSKPRARAEKPPPRLPALEATSASFRARRRTAEVRKRRRMLQGGDAGRPGALFPRAR